MPSTRLKADLLLLLTAVIWGLAFAAQRFAALKTGIFLFNAVRFALGFAALGLVWLVWKRRQPLHETGSWIKIPQAGLAITLSGLVLFLGSALQQAGLQYTTAANAGFITGLYVVIVPVLLALVLHRRVGWQVWLAALLAVAGLYLLSTGAHLGINRGDLLELAGAFMWALHVIVVAWAVRMLPLVPFSLGQFAIAGVLNGAAALVWELPFTPWTPPVWLAVLYVGIFSTAIGYTTQAAGQRYAPETDAAFILNLEAVFAALFGFLILGEKLLPVQLLGCGLILAAVLFVQLSPSQPPQLAEPDRLPD